MTQVKSKGGRAKVVKVKDETMPTPQGRRVIPRITSTMKDQAVKKADTKRGGKKGAVKVCEFCVHCFLPVDVVTNVTVNKRDLSLD